LIAKKDVKTTVDWFEFELIKNEWVTIEGNDVLASISRQLSSDEGNIYDKGFYGIVILSNEAKLCSTSIIILA